MTECAARLVDEVLPWVPVRQWVLSLPYRLRYLLAWDHGLARAVLAVAVRVLLGFPRQRARRAGIRAGRSGAVTIIIQRFGGGLNLRFRPTGRSGRSVAEGSACSRRIGRRTQGRYKTSAKNELTEEGMTDGTR